MKEVVFHSKSTGPSCILSSRGYSPHQKKKKKAIGAFGYFLMVSMMHEDMSYYSELYSPEGVIMAQQTDVEERRKDEAGDLEVTLFSI